MQSKVVFNFYTSILFIGIALILAGCSGRKIIKKADEMEYKYTFQNPSIDRDKRITDLISRMTVEEKVTQLTNQSAAIPRLGIPEYNWWNEALHGVARAGEATVFPQAIGLAATWDTDKIFKMADYISTEARAKHHEFVRKGERGIYKGLTFWSPNINIFRDPRWGRGQETYGEDPFLTSRIGVAFVKGLQGDDSKYLKAAACAKHFGVHSGPEHLRHVFDVSVSQRDFWETYMPAFEALIKEADVEAVMCAYNRFEGKACCGSDYLLTELIRKEWGFDGHVVSDCGAIHDIFSFHKLTRTGTEAAALALKSGTDVNCGGMFRSLNKAFKEGLISEKDIDRALGRLLSTRFKLGMFDPPEMVKYAQIPYSENNKPEHAELALQLARESIVLLKNENNTLPLSKNLKKIAVIGPNADSFDALVGNYNGSPVEFSTPLKGIKNIVSAETEVAYAKGTGYLGDEIFLTTIPASVFSFNGQKGIQAEYFSNMNLEGEPFVSRRDEELDWQWARGNPVPGLQTNRISARWTGEITPHVSGEYVLGLTGDDGYRLYWNGELVLDEWRDQGATTKTVTYNLEAGKNYPFKVEYFQNGGDAVIQLAWKEPGIDMHEEITAAVQNADAIIFVGGISPRFEGEEMGEQVKFEGFFRGDRTKISLPEAQTNLIKQLKQTGKPVILVNMSGSAVAVNWENEHIPAILQAWYPGQVGGQAIADVLFGNYNPAGRLPVTVYKSINDLPDYENYDMEGRTYRYFHGEPLYPFGYGLSFSNFEYTSVSTDRKLYKNNDTIQLKVNLRNNGVFDGDEVIQVYVHKTDTGEQDTLRELKGFKRIHLKSGQQVESAIAVHVVDLKSYDNQTNAVHVKPGVYQLQIGASSVDIRKKLEIEIH